MIKSQRAGLFRSMNNWRHIILPNEDGIVWKARTLADTTALHPVPPDKVSCELHIVNHNY